jgi:5'-phosphate synthase pdxT subunit
MAMVRSLSFKAIEVRDPKDLAKCCALIIPGGESTTMMKQMDFIELFEPLIEFAKTKPVFGTCAGLILMSKHIAKDQMKPLQLLDVDVERNAFGRQADSFETNLVIASHKMKALFIRAPRITRVGKGVKVLAEFNGEPVLVEQGLHLGATFHPELSTDPYIHAYFLRNCAA